MDFNPLSILGFGYNVYKNEQSRGDYLKQQRWLNDFAVRQQDFAEYTTHNAAQIRRADLEAAGLHPTLAAGGAAASTQAHMPGNHPQNRQVDYDIMQQALLGATIKQKNAEISRTQADTDRIRVETENDTRRVALQERELQEVKIPGVNINKGYLDEKEKQTVINQFDSETRRFLARVSGFAEQRQQNLHPLEYALKDLQVDLALEGYNKAQIERTMMELEQRFMQHYNSRMPIRPSDVNELERVIHNPTHLNSIRTIEELFKRLNPIIGIFSK